MTTIPEIKLETCERAFYNISFSPEERGLRHYEYYYNIANQIKADVFEAVATEKMQEKAIWLEEYYLKKWHELFTSYIYKTARCISSMITGPANFPVARAQKRNGYRDNAEALMREFVDTLKPRIKKAMLKTYTTKERAEMELEAKIKRIETLQEQLEISKELNKLVRKAIKKPELLEDRIFMSDVPVKLISAFKHCVLEQKPIAYSYELTSLNNKIKQAQKMVDKFKTQIEAIQEQEESGSDEAEPTKISETFSYLKNVAEDRLQLFFSFKPEPETRQLLKKSGFRWSPRFNAWQRQLTNNALYTFKHFILDNEDFKQIIA
jgi:hypothetical protein